MLVNAGAIGGLNRYSITLDNAVAILAAIHTIYTAIALYTDPKYERQLDFFDRALVLYNSIPLSVKIIVGLLLIGWAIGVTYATQGASAAIFVGIMSGISVLTGTVVSGAETAANGGSFWDGAVNGFANALLFVGITATVTAGMVGLTKLAKLMKTANAVTGFVGPVKQKASVVGTQAAGVQPWPPNDGAIPGTEQLAELQPGSKIGRFGPPGGSFATDPGTPVHKLSLRPGSDLTYTEYLVLKPLRAKKAVVMPWFNQPGLGIQYKFSDSIENLILSEIIRPI